MVSTCPGLGLVLGSTKVVLTTALVLDLIDALVAEWEKKLLKPEEWKLL